MTTDTKETSKPPAPLTPEQALELKHSIYDDLPEEAIVLEPRATFEDAIIGISSDERVVYSLEKIYEAHMKYDGMSQEEAVEWVDYNTLCIALYENGPVFVWDILR